MSVVRDEKNGLAIKRITKTSLSDEAQRALLERASQLTALAKKSDGLLLVWALRVVDARVVELQTTLVESGSLFDVLKVR